MGGLTLADIDQVDLDAIKSVYMAADSRANGSTDVGARLQRALESTPWERDSGEASQAQWALTLPAPGLKLMKNVAAQGVTTQHRCHQTGGS